VSLGVGLPFRQDAAARIRTRTGGDLTDLAVDPGPAADFLLRYGVPVTAGPARVNALFGQLAWAVEDGELERLLTGGLLLDGTAAAVLTERGFGPLIGVEVTEIVEREQHPAEPGPYAVERIRTEDGEIWLSVNTQPALARLAPAPGATVTTRVTTPDGQPWGPGRCRFTNDRGGRVVVLAATAADRLPYDDDGRRLLHDAVRFLEGDRPELPLVSGGPQLIPQLVRGGAGLRLAVANGSADPARPRVEFPGTAPDARATLLAPLAEPVTATAPPDGSALISDRDLPYRGWLLLHWE
jgi:hypothetical protein